jgi:hypothetical protein
LLPEHPREDLVHVPQLPFQRKCLGDLAGFSTARISGSVSMAARKSDSSSQARMAWACTTP